MIHSVRQIRRTRLAPIALLSLLGALACGGAAERPASGEPTPAPGEPASPQPPAPEPTSVTVSTSTAAPGSTISVRASGFTPESRVQIGIGQPSSEYSVVSEARTDAQGRLEITLEVPNWTSRGESYVVVVTEPDHDPREVSDPFVVGAPGDRVRIHGELTGEGTECPALRGPFGTLYTLAAPDLEYGPGTEVVVEGTIAQTSICMQGTTIDVESIESH